MNLYELNSEYQAAIERCRQYAEEHEGEISKELSDALIVTELTLENKIENTVMYYKNERSIYEAIQTEIDKLARRAMTHGGNADWAREWLAGIITPGNKIEFAAGKISWRKSTSVEITDAGKLPAQFLRVIPETHIPDKMAIKVEIISGKQVDGAQLTETQNIQIK